MKWKIWEKAKQIIQNNTSLEIAEKYKFPCSDNECLVRVACTKACDKIEMDEGKLMALFMEHNGCPDCGSGKFMEGPSGGMSTNVKCAGCGHWFNLALPISIERIHISPDGRFRD